MTKVFLGLGSNLLNPSQQLHDACARLLSYGIVSQSIMSSHYDSPALLPENAPDAWDKPFRNMVLVGETHLKPDALLEEIKRVERDMGRQDRGFWAPREIDIDILSYGEQVLQSQRLTIPHPQMHLRDFVLLPLYEVAPVWIHPYTGESIAQLVNALPHVSASRCEMAHA